MDITLRQRLTRLAHKISRPDFDGCCTCGGPRYDFVHFAKTNGTYRGKRWDEWPDWATCAACYVAELEQSPWETPHTDDVCVTKTRAEWPPERIQAVSEGREWTP